MSTRWVFLVAAGLLQGLHPDIAIEVKTCQAIRSVLNVMREGVKTLMEEGGVDEQEGLLFLKVIESKMKWLKSAPPRFQIPSQRKILAAIPWIDKDMQVVDYIQNVAQRIVFQYNDRIVSVDDPPSGIHVIISGLVRVGRGLLFACIWSLVSGRPSLTDSHKTLLQVVSPISPQSKTTMQTLDYLSTGNVVGEISELTRRPRMATLICETTVKTLYMSTENLETMFLYFSDLDPPLKSRLWQVCAIRVAANVLSKISSYVNVPREMLLSRLEDLQVRHVTTPTVDITREMTDVVLITGEAIDQKNGDIYIAPCFIPSRVKSLRFPNLNAPRAVNPTLCYTLGDTGLGPHPSRLQTVSIMDTSMGSSDKNM
ncbi:sodium/hydrogen exchanger 10 [Plakobranchus ocellatus]|uniref:Sodium/hydrogen exchanger 10 n=1 Tax=Plakobranchus ocellatus TaxID=259542 RepID=A0AAV4E338_9GAST|nr:sodium/hydrogen exchanger 10 [Plakobranchus ocellatus]